MNKIENNSKKERVARMFDRIARSYDFLNHFLSLGIDIYWRRRALAWLRQKNPTYILDVATGTADLALMAQKVLPAHTTIGIDISEKMLEIGRQKIEKKQLKDKITLYSGDSEQINFQENTFDAAMVAFGVRNFENPIKGLSEIRRVLKDKGTILVLEFSKPRLFPFKQLYNFYFSFILPLIGRIFSRDKEAYTYLPESVQQFPDGKAFGEMLQKAGFGAVQIKTMTLGVVSVYMAEK
ncbi:MAG: bifunctional demethylmenaquinone methyltransferase/2-methoxy-6-polyprenyl-1,4-benzoquinol methylase UbiE [Cytophagales bacterium]|nr:MAG: bifunctional demethylmenaquinone methyltransferase/2-methoxy-6-polyprenyl-1,4-benzoquinol methylase UbiE [Cytophagales bacterium]